MLSRAMMFGLALGCTATGLCAPAFAALMPGDVNSDTLVDAVDVQVVINAAVGISGTTGQTDINFDASVNAVDVQLVINAALGISIDAVPLAVHKFADPAVPAGTAADDLYSAFRAQLTAVGFDAAKAALDQTIARYIAGGGTLEELRVRSLDVPAGEYDPFAVAKRQAVRAYAKSHGIDDPTIAEWTMAVAGILPSERDPSSSAKTAGAPGNRVLFVNGINTDFHDFLEDMAALSSKVSAIPANYHATLSGFWNPNSTMPFQLAVCTTQKIEDWISGFSVLAYDDPVKMLLQSTIQAYVNAGCNVIVVPHSQGNFYTRTATGAILAGSPLTNGAGISVVETASPAGNMPAGVRYYSRVDVAGDLVAQLSGVYMNPPYPYEGSIGWGDTLLALAGTGLGIDPNLVLLLNYHSFVGAYMKGQAGAATLQHIKDYCILAPEVTGFAINAGAATTTSQNVTLNNTCKDSAFHAELPALYMASESSSFSGASWQPYLAAPSFTITSPGSGAKTVYFKLKNAAGESAAAIDSINLDGPPSVSTYRIDGSETTDSRTVTLNNTCAGSPTLYMASESSSFSGASWGAYSTAPSFTIGSSGNGVKTVYFKVKNAIGESTSTSDTITLNEQAPTVSLLMINGGAASSTSRTVTLNNVCTGNPTQYIASESPAFIGAAWQSYSAAPSFTIATSGNGQKTVYFKAKNGAGESSLASATISLDENTAETILLPGGVPLEMIWIPAGYFTMGCYPGEQDSDAVAEQPQHQVTFSQGFWMAKYELTKAQWTAMMGTKPWVAAPYYVLDDPSTAATHVCWNDAHAFITAINSYTGKTFRLPSEAEWEYACRAGTTTRFYWGDDLSNTMLSSYCWWWNNTYLALEKYAHPVGLKLPNAFGLYDMSGNVWEWCEDDWHADYTGAPANGSAWIDSPRGTDRVSRGGGWIDYNAPARSAIRGYDFPYMGINYFTGFRLAR